MAPQRPEPMCQLGALLAHLGRPVEAYTCYQQSIARDPGYAPAYSDLGALYRAQGVYVEAERHLVEALRLRPQFAAAHINLSATLSDLGRYEEAVEHAKEALRLRPHDLEASLNLGNAYNRLGRHGEAATAYRKGSGAAPRDPRPLNNLAETLRDLGCIEEADAAYRQALALDPGNGVIRSNHVYLHAFAHDLTEVQLLGLARSWEHACLTSAERAAAHHAACRKNGVFAGTPRDGRKLRLGIVSAELGSHAVAEFLQPFLEQLDRGRFHLTLISTVGRTDERAHSIRALADEYLQIAGMSDEAAVALVRGRGIDVLVDTSGHTVGNRLGVFARRAAPVQSTWIGYWSTTGLSEMDYALADPIAPVGAEAGFSERLWRLERINVCYRGDATLAIDWKPAEDGSIRLGSLNKFSKIREETIALWSAALRELQEARLLLEDRGTDETDSHRRLRAVFARHGIAGDRIEFVPYLPGHERHMGLYNQIDIALDTLPFNSGTTAFDALWMGVPLVTLEGHWNGGRIAAGLLRALGRPEWIASDTERFVAVVKELARDGTRLRTLRQTQRERMLASELADAARLTWEMEAAFEGMYDRWLEG